MSSDDLVPRVVWSPPQPRAGFAGKWDRLIGPGATRAEYAIQFIPAFAAGLGLPLVVHYQGLKWSAVQLAVGALLAFDMTGGAMTNATVSANRWYHRPGQGKGNHFAFVAIHALQLALVAWLFRNGDGLFFSVMYGYLLGSTLAILSTPLYLQRPLALLFVVGAILLNFYAFTPVAGMEWFIPVFFIKLLVSHLLRLTPYTTQPRDEKT